MKNRNIFLLLCTIFCAQFMMAQDYQWPLKTDFNDIKGGKNGTNHGVTFQNDVVRGSVATFDGSSYANLPQFISGNTAITIALWWRMDAIQPWARIYSFGNGDQTEPKDVMMLIPVNGAAAPFQNFYRFTLSDPAGPWYDLDVDPADLNIQLNQWNYSVVVIKSDSIIFYHNDKQIFADNGFTRKIETLNDTQNALGKSFWPDALWKGALSDLRVFKRALTQTEVIALYNSTKDGASAVSAVKAENQPAISVSNNRINVVLKQSDANAMVNVYGIAGDLVCHKSISELSNTTFGKGLFLVKVESNHTNYTQKVIIK
ncbi:MAG: hypothetical protein PHR83_05435 [Paludibacter sp.]|nr:hypothetical protein [Paludibacter sp.]